MFTRDEIDGDLCTEFVAVLISMGVKDCAISKFLYKGALSRVKAAACKLAKKNDFSKFRGVFFELETGQSVYCKSCREYLKTVPCPRCVVESTPVESEPERINRGPKPREPKESTFAEPGSLQKMRVMQARVAKGEAVEHPEDFRWFLVSGDPILEKYNEVFEL